MNVIEIFMVLICVGILAFYGILSYKAFTQKETYEDDGKPIRGVVAMEVHCSVVHTGTTLYQMLDCCVCPYREECKKYKHRYGKYPYEGANNE